MLRRSPISPHTYTPFPYTTLFRSLPGLPINLGGTTSIDVTRAGVDKGYGLKRLSKESGVPLAGMLFVGDAIYPGGNDNPAAELGIDTIRVRDVAETAAVVSALIACLKHCTASCSADL